MEAAPGDDYRFVARRRALPDPCQPLAAGGPARPVAGARPGAFDVDRRATGSPPAVGDLVLYELHVGTFTRRGHVRGRDPAPARAARARRHRDRADAGRRVPRPPRLGLRRRLPVRRAVRLRRPARPAAARRRRPPRGPRRAARRRLQPRRRVRRPGADAPSAPTSPTTTRRPGATAINYDDAHSGAVREWVAPERRAVGPRLPPRRPAARRHPRDQRRQPRAPRGGARRGRTEPGAS